MNPLFADYIGNVANINNKMYYIYFLIYLNRFQNIDSLPGKLRLYSGAGVRTVLVVNGLQHGRQLLFLLVLL